MYFLYSKFPYVFLLLIAFLFLLPTATAWFVQCPTNDTKLTNCSSCYQSGTQIQCLCQPDQYNIAGRCFNPFYPCKLSRMSLIYDMNNTQYNLWNGVIAPFWTKVINQSMQYNNITSAQQMPQWMNYGNFTNMTNYLMQGWTSGYYLYKVLSQTIQMFNKTEQNRLLWDVIIYVNTSIITKTTMAKWNNMRTYFNKLQNANYTDNQFYLGIIRPKAKLYAPCHKCQIMYGVSISSTSMNTICIKCPPNCQNCTANTTHCLSCFQGYYLNSTDYLCHPCQFGKCKTCTQNGICNQCISQYTLVNNTCIQCTGDCIQCINNYPSVCQRCLYIYYGQIPTSTGQCIACIQQQCNNCSITNPSFCIACFQGYYNNSKGLCKACSQNCRYCINQTVCTQCFYGYGVINGSCWACMTPGCIFCDDDISICSACVTPQFTFNLYKITCQLTSLTTAAGKFLYQTAQCRPGCDYCYDNNNGQCFTCHQRYYNQDRYCKKCMPGCLQCVNADVCLNCIFGYTLNTNSSKCVKCPQDCRECDWRNITICTACRVGMYLLANYTCVPVPDNNCFIYDDFNTTCIVCMPGFALTNNSQCIQCQTSCIWTCNPLNISQCKQNRYQLKQWFLYRYASSKQGCNAQVNNNCLSPQQGYQLYNTTNAFLVRKLCLFPCSQCYDNNTCIKCKPGYQLDGNGGCQQNLTCNPTCNHCLTGTQRNYTDSTCVRCIVDNCGSCVNGSCLQCKQGYYLQNSTCKQCPQKCKICYDANNCKVCSVGYLWPNQLKDYSYDCLKCHQNCLTCKFSAILCSSCRPGKKLSNFRCINQYNIVFQYTLDYNYTTFMSTMQSQILISSLRQILKGTNYNDIYINNIRKGSVIIDGVISAQNDTIAKQYYQTMRTTQLPNYKVKNTYFVYMNDTTPQACSSSGPIFCPPTVQNDYNKLSTGAIIAIAVLSSLAGLTIIGIIVYCLCFKGSNDSNMDAAGQNNEIKSHTSSVKTFDHLPSDSPFNIHSHDNLK